MVKITLFCGGRGGTSLIQEILRIPEVELNLLVNAYDNGSSTGEMRRFIPGYLGPSDFRKNLSYLLELHSPEQYALTKLIEYRMPADFDKEAVRDFIAYLSGSPKRRKVPGELINLLQALSGEIKKNLYDYLLSFFAYYLKHKNKPFHFGDCSFGNLVFAGAFFKNKNSFEKATQEVMTVFQSKINAKLINVTTGENRFLMALKDDSQFLEDEAKIVATQNRQKFIDIYLIPEEFTEEELQRIRTMKLEDKRKFLEVKEREVGLSETAKAVIEDCDIIMFGPGTQFSSLFPSYKTEGIGEAISSSNAQMKVFIVNINKDHDIQSYRAEDLIDTALNYLNDEKNNNLITHALFNKASNFRRDGIKLRGNPSLADRFEYKNIEILIGDYEHPIYLGIHSGTKTIKAVLDLYERKKMGIMDELDIYVDLNERSLAVRLMVEEFLELDWRKYFPIVRLYINNVELPNVELPHHVEIHATKKQGYYSEVDVFNDWFWNKKSEYLVTISGDGEYRLSDITNSINILTNSTFGAVYGSRNQSRQQFVNSISAAYGESRFVFVLSRLGAISVGVLFALRFRILFSDPLTGFRVYNRRILKKRLRTFHGRTKLKTSMALTRHISRNRIEIAEMPVRYRTFKGFTNVKWRLFRGLRNLAGIFL